MTMSFVAFALMMIASTAAHAVGVAFTTTSLPRQMRQDGLTEVAGEIVLTALNGGDIVAGSSIDIVYSVAITNNSTASTNNISLANNIACTNAAACPGTAVLTGSQTIRLAFAAATTTFVAGDQIVISKVRVNANSAVGVGTVTATMAGNSANTLNNPITFTDPQRQVGVLNAEIAVRFNTTANPVTFLQTCNFPNVVTGAFSVRIDEVFPAALTTLAQEITASNALLPNSGVVVRISLTGVPAGVTIIAPATVNSTDLNGVGVTAAMLTNATTSQDSTSAGSTLNFDYVVAASDTSQVERNTVNFQIRATSTSTANTIALASIGNPVNIQGTVSVTPISSTDSNIIRFVANGIGPTTLVNITDCNTRLLFTWAATVADVETGIAIANTTSDDAAFGSGTASGATSQNGTCTLTGYPSAGGTPVSFTTASINAGSTLAFLLSTTTGFSNFTGYILTVCNFQVGHAFAFITNGRGTVTGPTLAQGYLANVIPGGTRPPAGTTLESLGD
jgi:hypothetical protein